MSLANFNLFKDLGYTGTDSPNCFPAAFDTIADRDIKLATYRDYEQLIMVLDSIPPQDVDAQIIKMNNRIARDLGVRSNEWVYLRAVTEGGLDRKLTELNRRFMLPVIDVIHSEMNTGESGIKYTHALGVTAIGKGYYELSGSWVPENLTGKQTAESILPHLAQSEESPYIPRTNYPAPYYGANISALPRR